MEMLNIIGQMDKVDEIAKKIILSSSVHMVNTLSELQQSSFPVSKAQENVDALIDYNYIKQYVSQKNLKDTENKLEAITSVLNLKKKLNLNYVKENYDFDKDTEKINEYYEMVKEKYEKLLAMEKEEKGIKQLLENLEYLKKYKFNLNELLDMQYIKVKFGKVLRANVEKIEKNYENISAIVFKVHEDKDYAFLMVFMPEPIEIEVDRVLSSLNFEEFKINSRYSGTPEDWINELSKRHSETKKSEDEEKGKLIDFKKENSKEMEAFYSRLQMEYKIEELKSYMACTSEFFNITGWIPEYKKNSLDKLLSEYGDELIVMYKTVEEMDGIKEPPTCLKNNPILRPFEALVRMYGIPSYTEIDPTVFLGITYMFLYGAMFGDMGQGLVFAIAGTLLVKKWHRPNLGGVLARIGICSMIFGFIYGSVFGFDLKYGIKGLPLNPMENMNTMLIAAIIIGVFLMSIGMIFNVVNGLRNKDYENGIFSKNGIVGIAFYWLLLYTAAAKILGKPLFLPMSVLVGILVVLLFVIMLKTPITNMILGKKQLYNDESVGDYYVENGFGVVEILLSIFSNTLSFIRVGAFAINHVGLFIAFKALGQMTGSAGGNAVMLLLGNIVIIGLEGLIVFIQGLRLEYYELFSKYYKGEGYEYEPFHLEGASYSVNNNNKFNVNEEKTILASVE